MDDPRSPQQSKERLDLTGHHMGVEVRVSKNQEPSNFQVLRVQPPCEKQGQEGPMKVTVGIRD